MFLCDVKKASLRACMHRQKILAVLLFIYRLKEMHDQK